MSFCEEEGIEPHETYSGLLIIRLTPEIHSKVATLAKQTGLSIKNFIKKLLKIRFHQCFNIKFKAVNF